MTSDLATNEALVPHSVSFDYSALSEDDALRGRAAASRIKRRNHKMVEAIIENGQDLLAMKLRIPHGQFEAWIDAECGVSERTARNYMAAARAFGGKTAIVADLSPTTIYALTSADNVRSDVIEKRGAGQKLDEQAIGEML